MHFPYKTSKFNYGTLWLRQKFWKINTNNIKEIYNNDRKGNTDDRKNISFKGKFNNATILTDMLLEKHNVFEKETVRKESKIRVNQ